MINFKINWLSLIIFFQISKILNYIVLLEASQCLSSCLLSGSLCLVKAVGHFPLSPLLFTSAILTPCWQYNFHINYLPYRKWWNLSFKLIIISKVHKMHKFKPFDVIPIFFFNQSVQISRLTVDGSKSLICYLCSYLACL